MRIFLLLSFLLSTYVSAAVYKGQSIFVTECAFCHTDIRQFVLKHDAKEWKEMMINKGKPLAYIHIHTAEAQDSLKYFMGKQFSKDAKHLKDFLMEYSKDSGKVPVLN